MKRRIFLFLLMSAVIFSCHPIKNPNVVHVTGISLDPTELTVVEGDNAEITATVTPSDAADPSVKWSSSNADVVYVREGKLMAIKEGEADVTATTTDGGFTAVCKVTVIRNTIYVQSVTVAPSTLALVEGESGTLTATVAPANADDKSVTWTIDKADVASVDAATGKVTAIKAGTATITATTTDGGKTATCELTVTQPQPNSVSLNYTTYTITKGEELQLVATVLPENAGNKAVTWSTSDEKLATVDQNGLVKAIAPGEVTITVVTEDGAKTAACVITVLDSGDFSGGNEGYNETDLN